MDTDLALAAGLVLLLLALPALVGAWADRRRPSLAAALLLAGGALVGLALWLDPTGYRPRDVPGVMVGVIARWL